MKKIGMLFAFVMLAACGGSKSDGAKEPAPAPVAMEAEDETLPSARDTTYAAPTPTQPEGPTEPVETVDPMDEPVAAAPMKATADLVAYKGGASMGTITFERNDEGAIMIYGTFTGLKKNGVHALYIHENGDCGNKGKAAGGHLNPTKAKHGPPASSERHAGDFGNLTADEEGNAIFSMTTDSVTMEGDRPDSVINRAVMIHSKKDTKKGNAGTPLACGVITLATE